MDNEALFKRVEQVESGGNPYAVSPKGAVGPMQTMPTTLVDPGYGVRPAKDDSIDEKRRVGKDYLSAMLTEYGNLPHALAAYNWGPGNVDKWLKAGGDTTKLPAETRDYITKIAGGIAEDTTVAAKAVRGRLLDTIRRPLGSALTPESFGPRADAEEFDNVIRTETEPGFLGSAFAAMAGNTQAQIFGEVYKQVWGPKYEPEEGFKPSIEELEKVTSGQADRNLVDEYGQAKSTAEARALVEEFQDEQRRQRDVMGSGVATGVALSFLAEVPDVMNVVPGVLASKVMALRGVGSAALAADGAATARVLGAAVTENVLGGTAVEAVRQYMTGEFDVKDLGLAMVIDTALGAAMGGFDVSKAGKAAIRAGATEQLEKAISYAKRAETELGPGATPSDLRKAMDQFYKDDMTGVVKAATADIPVERQLIKEAPLQKDLTTDTRFASPDNAAEEAAISVGETRWNELRQLGLDLPDTADEVVRTKAIEELNTTPGTHLASSAKSNLALAKMADSIEKLRAQMIPDVSLHIGRGDEYLTGNTLGVHALVKPSVSVISLRPNSGALTAVHEFMHAVFAHKLASEPLEKQAAMRAAWQEWRDLYVTPGKAQEAALRRSPVARASLMNPMKPDGTTELPYAAQAARGGFKEAFLDVWDKAWPNDPKSAEAYGRYFANFDEYAAEQGVKYVEAQVTKVGDKLLTVPQQIVQAISFLLEQALELFGLAKKNKLIEPDAPFKEFFDDLLMGNKAKGLPPLEAGPLQAMSVPAKPAAVVNEVMTDPATAKFGMTVVPVGTAAERKQAQAMLALHKQAAEWETRNPMDAAWNARVQNLADNSVFNVASTGLLMLKSQSPLVRMIASELLEDASGVAGKRQATAAISKYLTERFMLGNAINDVQGAYAFWKKGKPGGFNDDLIGGNNWAAFNKEIAAEIEARRLAKGPVSQDPNIKAAADTLEAAYQRTANAQRSVNTLGSEGLPESSVGYMPHRMSPKAVINMTNEQGQIVHDALVDQFITIEGWDASFSDQLASTYMKRVRDRASGDYGSNIGGGNPSTNSLVEEALRAMDLPEATIKGHMDKFSKGSANFTKGRIELDLNKVYATADGEFKLLDIFETNQLELLRSQAGRASGEVALTKFGVRGKPGLKLLRDAMAYGEDGKKAGVKEKEAFDQMAAEFMNEPFGTQSGKFMERAMAANTLVRLGGIAFNQIAESINGIFHVGAARAMASVASIPRLRGEIKALAAGQKIDNPFLSSIELAGGAEFGTDAYKIVMPFDSPDHAYPTYGQDTLTVTDRLLRGGGYLQGKLSGWRLVHSAQQRGMAEQIVHKMMRYVREGSDDVALQQFGITTDVQAALKADLNKVATFDQQGNLTRFDVTQITDPDIREQVIQAVWRGTSQIIQGTFIGERGKWAHDGWLKMMTQFRSFSITSMEKQWGRQRNSRGSYAAFGMMLGSMSIAAPIYMARTYAASVGRPDQEEFLEQRLQPEAIARATLNYIAMSGMAGDFIDLTSSLLPEELGVTPTGGRSGVETDFVGNYVLPASSLVNDVWKYAQSPLKVDDAVRILPMSRLPYLLPLTNATKD